jgi:hypothetical protein
MLELIEMHFTWYKVLGKVLAVYAITGFMRTQQRQEN